MHVWKIYKISINQEEIEPFYYLSDLDKYEARDKLLMGYETSKLYTMEKCDKKFLFKLFDEYGTDFELEVHGTYDTYRSAQQTFIRIVKDDNSNINNYIPTGREGDKDYYKKYRERVKNDRRERYHILRDKKLKTMNSYYERMKECKVLCECGVEVVKFSKSYAHDKTKKHLEAIKNNGLSMD